MTDDGDDAADWRDIRDGMRSHLAGACALEEEIDDGVTPPPDVDLLRDVQRSVAAINAVYCRLIRRIERAET